MTKGIIVSIAILIAPIVMNLNYKIHSKIDKLKDNPYLLYVIYLMFILDMFMALSLWGFIEYVIIPLWNVPLDYLNY